MSSTQVKQIIIHPSSENIAFVAVFDNSGALIEYSKPTGINIADSEREITPIQNGSENLGSF